MSATTTANIPRTTDVTKPWKNKQFFRVKKIANEPPMSTKPPWDEPNFDKVPEPSTTSKRSPKRA